MTIIVPSSANKKFAWTPISAKQSKTGKANWGWLPVSAITSDNAATIQTCGWA